MYEKLGVYLDLCPNELLDENLDKYLECVAKITIII